MFTFISLIVIALVLGYALRPYLALEIGDRTYVLGSRVGFERDMRLERAAAMRRHPSFASSHGDHDFCDC